MTQSAKAAALLDRLRALAQGATPGPRDTQSWGDFPPEGMAGAEFLAESVSVGDDEFVLVAGERARADARFIAAANPEVVLEIVEALRYSLVDWRGDPRLAVVSALARAFDALEPEGGA